MNSVSAITGGSVSSPSEESLRIKFLCSFLGSILPRPQDGQLRYVGGETRIVSVPRDINYDELVMKMKELYELTAVLKYQQPDEDLDSLVSVVNDDDVMNMMEEYDKLSSGDGFTRLRFFLFSYADLESSSQFIDADERETERRYVDALNNINESTDLRNRQFSESPGDDFYVARNYDLPVQQFNLRHLRVPPMDGTRSPVYHSPRHSPSSAPVYRAPFPEFQDRISEEHCWQQPNHDIFPFDHQLRFSENGTWYHRSGALPSESARFPCNMFNIPHNGNNGYHDSRRNQACSDSYSKHGEQLPIEHPNYRHGLCLREQNDPRSLYNEFHCRGRGWNMQHISIPSNEEPRSAIALDGLQNSHHVLDSNVMHAANGHQLPVMYNVHNEDPRFIRSSPEQGNVAVAVSASHVPITPLDERGIRYGNIPYSRVSNGFAPMPHLSGQNSDPLHNGLSYEQSTSTQLSNGTRKDNQNPCHEHGYSRVPYFTPSAHNQEKPYLIGPGLLHQPSDTPNLASLFEPVQLSSETMTMKEKDTDVEVDELLHQVTAVMNLPDDLYVTNPVDEYKEAALENHEELKPETEGNDNYEDSKVVAEKSDAVEKEENGIQSEAIDTGTNIEEDSDNEDSGESKIEPTKAEEEAVARGLQTIRNDDLEEVKELGSGNYGAVYHGKWKGSDVAIKKIKASCFSGKPSERERLIADFWKEALILGSLHHPNVVSFYGIVRDGPDGSLATVTEFMINGSLKQYLQKKDRTIDRRKRLIIAMDAAFGMEYLHGKNIVHFDLKCENLLVNMRDPHRPVCKIGDLGLSKVKQHTLVSGGVRGTLPWMAPELLSGKSNMVSEKIDVYSFGIVMWELLTGEEPYADMHCASLIAGIVNDTLRPTIPTWCDPEWKSLMGSCWGSDPSERPSFAEISKKLRNMAAAINVK
ncbi:probable serine/threonine-protein kinase DDB_G0281745 [Impatiens glandulifera]|uniref:probable serine/threonine-protein kinase DDB_G0281745 n=1 Tax=Impatiens glandulifera TaxID=253017 RepID=UPI001FB11DDB|nr:probable serine/threonine-protein kinase DDB_G0281745 [Impatiens glandulifera]